MKPKVSIIVPVYNPGKYFDACLESVLAQTCGDWELILVDDASTDGSGAKCDTFAGTHSAVKVAHTEGVGVSEARNIGLKMAEGEYITFLDSDDRLLPDALAEMLGLMTADVDVAVGQFEEIKGFGSARKITSEAAIESTLYQEPGFHESACAKLYRRELFEGLEFAKGRRYEDLEIFARIYVRARGVTVTDRRIYEYTPNPASFINNWSEARKDALWAVDAIAKAFGRRFPQAARSRCFSAYFNVFNLAVVNGKRDVALSCWREIKAMRKAILHDRRSRLKNRAAALASFSGRLAMSLLSHLIK